MKDTSTHTDSNKQTTYIFRNRYMTKVTYDDTEVLDITKDEYKNVFKRKIDSQPWNKKHRNKKF